MKKAILIIIDGIGDKPIEEFDGKTPLEAAKTPNMDKLAKEGINGRMYIIGKGIAPESDTALFPLFGYDPFKNYTGRGPIEALGVGLKTRYGELSLRGNFVSVDKDMNIKDIRAGRIESKYAKKLVDSLKKIKITNPDTEFIIKHTKGYRFIIKFKTKKYHLSSKITNVHPSYIKVGIDVPIAISPKHLVVKKSVPLTNSRGAILASKVVNQFIEKANKILASHPINKKRRIPANGVVVRDAGNKLPNIPTLNEKYNMSWVGLGEMPAEVGFCKLVGMDIETPEKDLKKLANKINELKSYYDGVYGYVKGADNFAHDGNPKGKKEMIEKIDKELIGNLKLNKNTILCITADHSTPCKDRVHTDDPVPVLIWGKGKDGVEKYGESYGEKGKLGIFQAIELMGMLSCT